MFIFNYKDIIKYMTKEEIQNIYDYSKSKSEIVKKLNIKANQNSWNIDKDILEYFSQIGIKFREQISKTNLSKHWLEIQKRDYELNPKYCLNCGKIIPFERRFNIYCSTFCGTSYGNKKRGKRTEEEKRKISESLKKYNKENGHNLYIEQVNLIKQYINKEITIEDIRIKYPILIKKCKECGKEYIPLLQPNGYKISCNKYCSKECHNIAVSKQSSLQRKKEIQNGTFQGWKSRNITSYAEKFWKQVLDNNDIKYIREQLVEYGNLGNGERYFLDFYIEHNGRKIDLEIDGKQHKYKNRQESDIKRDEFLKLLGYEVYRIDWNSINNDKGKELMKEKIDKFLEFYNI